MPRKAKEKIDKDEIIDEKKSIVKKSTAKKKADASKKSVAEKPKTKSTATTVEKPLKKSTKKVAKTTPKKTASTENVTKKASSRKSTLAKIIESINNETEDEKIQTVKKKNEKKESVEKPKKKLASKEIAEETEKNVKKKSASKTTKEAKTKSTKKETKKSSPEKTAVSEKKTSKKQPSKRTTKKAAKKEEQPVQILEYYDLPYKYGNTVVRLLAQTPKTLFVYWEVSDSDIENFKKTYGDDFFNKTRPILIVHNLTLNKTTEIEINDFANCWYLNTDDTDCKFDIELARKFIESDSDIESSDYLYVAQSNDLQSPNNHILFEKIQEFVVFRNVNNDNVIKKNIKSFKFLKDIYKFYKDMYDEDVLNNPSSQFKF